MLLPSIVYDQMEEKLSNRLMAAILKDFRSENLKCSKNQLIFVTAEEVVSMPFLFRLKKKTASPFHSLALRMFVFVRRQCFRFLI